MRQLDEGEAAEQETEEESLAGLRKEFESGSRSPYLYVRVWELYQKDSQLLTGLSDFELQVLMFAAKRKLMEDVYKRQYTWQAPWAWPGRCSSRICSCCI